MARTSTRTTIKDSGNMSEIGSSGLRSYGGIISEEFLRQLAGPKGVKTFMEMRDNDPTVGSILFIIDKLLRNVKWRVEAADESPAAQNEAEFMKSCMDDMEHSWPDFISEALSMLPFGWSALELVYKYRKGMDTTNPSQYSQYNDGRIGWRKLPLRAQETLWAWEFDDNGGVTALVQMPPVGSGTRTIPIDKLLMFRTQSYKNNPQGRSVLRNAYRPWFFKKRIEEIEGIGIERDLAGLPVAKVPAELLLSTATPEQKATLNVIKKLVTSIRRDEQEGIVFPLVYDENKNEMYKLELLSTGGTRQFDTSQIIDRYDKRIAMTVLADFVFLGQSKVGSFALSSDKTDMFSAALGAWLTDIAEVLNRKARTKLMQINGVPRELWPKFVPSDIEKEDVAKFCDNIYKLVGVGALIPDSSVNDKIREMLGLPVTVSDGNTITPMDLIEQRLADSKNKNTEKAPNGKKNPGIEKK